MLVPAPTSKLGPSFRVGDIGRWSFSIATLNTWPPRPLPRRKWEKTKRDQTRKGYGADKARTAHKQAAAQSRFSQVPRPSRQALRESAAVRYRRYFPYPCHTTHPIPNHQSTFLPFLPTYNSTVLCPSPPDRIPHLKGLHRSTSAPFTSAICHSRTSDHAPSIAPYHPHLLTSTLLFFRRSQGKSPRVLDCRDPIRPARQTQLDSQLTRFGTLPPLFFSNHMLLHIDH